MSPKRILIVPPPKIGGGPSNAVLRCATAMRGFGASCTTNVFSAWHAALLNVGVGVRFDVLRLMKMGRRVVYRADGCYVRDIFRDEGNAWLSEYDKINARIGTALKVSDHVIYQSWFTKRYLDEIFTRPEGTYDVIYNAVDLGVFKPTRSAHSELPVVGCIGTFRLNRLRTIVDIAQSIPFRHQLLLVGRMDEQCRRDLQQFQRTAHHCDVRYVPPVLGDQELAKWHNAIDCFLHPVLSDWCPNAVIEALACGTPVVLAKGSGGGEIVGDSGVSVNISPRSDYQSLIHSFAAAVSAVFDDWHSYSLRSRQRAVALFDVATMARRYLSTLCPA